jgi:hypothetical protein
MNKTKSVSLVSPKGEASYAFLNNPSTKFKPEGEFSVKLKVSGDEAVAFVEKVKSILKDAYKDQCMLLKKDKLKLADYPWKEEDGSFLIKFAAKAQIKAKDGTIYDKKVALFDTQGNPVTEYIGSNSIIRVAAEIFTWYAPLLGMGVSLRMKAVQVIQLVAPSRMVSSEAFGFSAEEEGFVSGGESFPDEVFAEAAESPLESVASGDDF